MKGEQPGADPRVMTVLVTVSDAEAGRALARTMVREGLAACGNVIPGLTSVYVWEGKIHEDPEALVLFKTTEGGVEALRERVAELHGYDVPEFLALSVVEGHLPYLRWVAEQVRETEDQDE